MEFQGKRRNSLQKNESSVVLKYTILRKILRLLPINTFRVGHGVKKPDIFFQKVVNLKNW